MSKARALEKVKAAQVRQVAAKPVLLEAITAARAAGCSWDEIGAVLGVTKQAASQFHKGRR